MSAEGVNYLYICCLGNGTYGDVKLYRDIRTNKKVVIKSMKLMVNNISMYDVAKEILIMSKLDHPRIIKFLSCFEDEPVHKLNIVMEYASGGTLCNLIDRYRTQGIHFPEKTMVRLFCEILMGVDYLHLRHVIHCDLKPENILLDMNMRVKIADFGISLVNNNPNELIQASAFGTPLYMAPEVYHTRCYGYPSDVWSLGVILYEMATLKHPFSGRTLYELGHAIQKGDFEPIPLKEIDYDLNIQVIVKMMLIPGIQERCSLKAVLCHPFIVRPYYEVFFS
ncbi:mitogen-activated protein kinase kinase kinase 7-like [Sergentomyia squamirostris]